MVVSWSTFSLDAIDPRLEYYELDPFGNFDRAAVARILLVIDGIISAAVQIFFSWCATINPCLLRIWFLNQTIVGRTFVALITIVAVLQLIVSLVLSNLHHLATGQSITIAFLVANFIADVLIASSMLYALRMAQHQSLSKSARTIISRLMVNAIETGAVTVVVAGAGIVLFPLSGYFETIMFILGPLFPNVCLANLNARTQTRRLGDDPQFSTAIHTGERDQGSGRANTTLRFARRSTILAQSEAVEP
ncbi:hypothetical protein BD779DRAFT_1678077 [Infundibulicybe gibba]|nr:hypothetical protein BD779DRAFT_1678077 [Infundibulicybe gibba]